MNQVLKDKFWSQGNQKWVDYIKDLTGMNSFEQIVFQGFHDMDTDETIIANLGVQDVQFSKLEASVEKKVLWGMLYCIDYTMKHDK